MRNNIYIIFLVFIIGFLIVWSYYAVFYDPLGCYNRSKIEHNKERIDQISDELDSLRNQIRQKD